MLLAFSEIKPVFGFQLLAYLLVAVHVVPVRNGLAVVVYAVEHDMHVRVFPVLVAHDDVLRISDFISRMYSCASCTISRLSAWVRPPGNSSAQYVRLAFQVRVHPGLQYETAYDVPVAFR